MAVASRLISLLTLSILVTFICSFQATPVNALSVEHASRGIHHRGHDALAKRKRSTNNNAKRCKPRSAPTSAPASASATPAPAPATSSSSPAAPSSSPAPAPAPAAPNFSGNNPLGLRNKQAAGWTLDVNLLPDYNPSLIYNWSPVCPQGYEKFNAICCPMYWGDRDEGTWNSEIVNKGVVPKCIMGMNEPELPASAQQSNMSPDRAAQVWRQYFNPLAAKGTYIFSPAPTSDPAGKTWLQNFFQQCPDCHVDAMAVHWYDVDPDALIAYLNDMHSSFGNRPVVLTEFACQNFNNLNAQCSDGEVWAFQQKVKAFIDQTPWMMGAAPFGIFPLPLPGGVTAQNGLANWDGSPNALGKAWYSSS